MEAIFGRIGFIGGGAMAEGLVRGLLGRGVPASSIWVSDANEGRLAYMTEALGVNAAASNSELAATAGTVILAVKPQVLPIVLDEVTGSIDSQLVISIVAGVSLRQLSSRLASGVPIVRVMPNTPCMIGRGAIAMSAGPGCMASQVERAKAILACAGTVAVVREDLMDAVTGLSGSGPAYVYTFIEALIDGGVNAGLPRDIARTLAIETVLGAAEMVRQTGEHPAILRDKVTSPGGTTIAALAAMEEAGFRTAVMKGVGVATAKSGELGKLLEGAK